MDTYSNFVSRQRELSWLSYRLHLGGRRYTPIAVWGPSGVGKTELVRAAVNEPRTLQSPSHWRLIQSAWFSGFPGQNMVKSLGEFIKGLNEKNRTSPDLVVVLDDIDGLSEPDIERAVGGLYNLKSVLSVVLISRRRLNLPTAEMLSIEALQQQEAEDLLRRLARSEIPPTILEEAARSTRGYPAAIALLARRLNRGGEIAFADLLKGTLYDISTSIEAPTSDILTIAVPRIVTVKEALIDDLKKFPDAIHQLSPRKFEELLADLLAGMGWEVELTPQTRDGGKDILAYLHTDLGKILCLVEAKKYRRDRKIGVDLVRTLYGTLCDHQANSAMLATTSSFSADAREFQRRHQYQLSLKDYGDIVEWVQRHKHTNK